MFQQGMYRLAVSVLGAVLAVAVSVEGAPATGIFWGEQSPNGIGRADLGPVSNQQTIFSGDSTQGVAVDEIGGKFYWTDTGPNRIRRADLDGSNAETLLTNVIAQGITIDTANQKFYWTEKGTDVIGRADLDGSNAETFLEIDQPWGIAVDVNSQKLYFSQTEFGIPGPNNIQRINLDGSGLEHLVDTNSARHIDLDLDNGHIYWAEQGKLRIRRADLDGSNATTVVRDGLFKPRGIAVDPDASKVYFSSISPNDIRRVNFDGSGMEILPLLDTSTASPQDIDLAFVVPEPSSVLLALAGGIGLLGVRRDQKRAEKVSG